MVLSSADKAVIEACFIEKGWKGAKIIREFPGKGWTKSSVNRLIKKLDTTGTTDRKRGSGRPCSVSTDDNIDNVCELIASQEDTPGTHLSQRKIAKRLHISRGSVRKIINGKLKFRPFKRIKTSRKTDSVKEKRKTRARRLLDNFNTRAVQNIVFTDEKDFPLEIPLNSKNDVVYGKKKSDIPPSRLYHEQNRFTKKVMVSAGVSWNGKTQIHFLDTSRVKVNADRYIELLRDRLLPDINNIYPNNDFILQQDGATSHTSRLTQQFLEDRQVVYIKKDDWPPNSGDLNPMDYAIWNQLSEAVFQNRREPFSERELKLKIVECWNDLSMDSIRTAIRSWKVRLRDVITADGGSIEHMRL